MGCRSWTLLEFQCSTSVSQTELPHCLGKLQSPLGKQQVYSLIVEVSGRGRPAFLLPCSPQHQGTTLFYISSQPSFTSLRSRVERSIIFAYINLTNLYCSLVFLHCCLGLSCLGQKKGRGCQDSRVSVSSVVMIHHHPPLSPRAEAETPLSPCLSSALVPLPLFLIVPPFSV